MYSTLQWQWYTRQSNWWPLDIEDTGTGTILKIWPFKWSYRVHSKVQVVWILKNHYDNLLMPLIWYLFIERPRWGPSLHPTDPHSFQPLMSDRFMGSILGTETKFFTHLAHSARNKDWNIYILEKIYYVYGGVECCNWQKYPTLLWEVVFVILASILNIIYELMSWGD